MTLDTIRQQTTWNDAAASINSNFAKLLQAIIAGVGNEGFNEEELRNFLESSGYTTEEWVLARGYITASSLVPYAKKEDLSSYATIEALSILQGQHDTLRSEFDALNNLLSSDTSDYINTWNEVVAFLDGYKDESDLATILSGMNADISSRLLASDFESWKTNVFTPTANLVANHTTRLDGLDQSILSINTRIDGVDKTIEDHIAEFIAFRANFEISDDLILVRKNFASTEEVSAKGINQGTGGGGGSSYSRLDTWEGYDNNKAGYVLSAGLGYGLKVAIDELNGYDLNNRVSTIENSYVSKDASGVINGGLVVSSLAIAGGSSSQFLKADGSLDGTSYLPKSGGTLSGEDNTLILDGVTNSYIFFKVASVNKASVGYYRNLAFIANEGTYARIGVADDGTPQYWNDAYDTKKYSLLHEGNYASLLDNAYLRKTSTNGYYHWQLTSTSEDGSARFIITNNSGFLLGLSGTEEVTALTHYPTYATLSIGDEITFVSRKYNTARDILHTGNFNSYAPTLTGTGASGTWGIDITGNAAGLMTGASHLYAQHNDTDKYIVFGYQTARNGYSTTIDGTSITFRDGGSNPTMLINSAGNVLIGTTENMGYKLDVNGKTHLNAYVGDAAYVDIGAHVFGLRIESRGNGNTYFQSRRFDATTAYYNIVLQELGGNVLIGTTTDNGAKLQVNGGITTKGYIDVTEQNSSNVFTLTTYSNIARIYAYDGTNDVYRDIYIGQNSGNALVVTGGGNVGIGNAPSPSYKLDVIGDIRATESITIGGATLSWENGALKVNTSFYSEKEISAKGLSTGGGSGASYNRLDAWGDYDSSKAGYVLSAYLGDDLNTRLSSLSGVVDTHTSRLSSLENAGYITSSALSGYLPLTGGTMSGSLGMTASEVPAGAVGLWGSSTLYLKASDKVYFYNSSTGAFNEILHQGNIGDYAITPSTIGSQSVAYASNAGGIQGSTSSINFALGHNRLEMINNPSSYMGDFASAYQSGISVITEYVGWQMTIYGGAEEHPYFRSLAGTGRWKPWRRLAFLDDNVESATKLATPRTIWGQSFDGTGNITNPATMQYLFFANTGSDAVGYVGKGLTTNNTIYVVNYTADGPVRLFTNNNINNSLILNSSGNVTIGASDLAGTGAKLYVDGRARFAEISDTSAINHYDSGKGYFVGLRNFGLGVTTGGLLLYTYGGTPISFYTNGGERMHINASGNVGIGTTYPQQPLHVNGVARVQRRGLESSYLDITVGDVVVTYNGYDSDGFCSHSFRSNDTDLLYLNGHSNDATFYGSLSVNSTLSVANTISSADSITTSGGHVSAYNGFLINNQNKFSGLVPNSRISGGGNATDVWMYVEAGKAIILGELGIDLRAATTISSTLSVSGILTVGGASIHPTANNPYFQLYQNNNYWYWQADNSNTYIGGTMSKALRIDQDGNTLIRGSLGVDALLTASNGLTVSKGISATDGIVSDWITAANITANTSATIAALTVSGLSTFTGGVVAYDIHGNGQSLYLGNASNNAYIKVREDMVGSSSMWSIPRDGKATFTSLTTPTLSVTGSATIASVAIEAGNATLSNLTVNTAATLKQLVVGIDGISCNGPATFNDFIYGSSITPRTDNYYVLGNNNYKWYAVTAYNVNVHDAITIEAGKELRFKDNNGVVHTLKYDSAKQAFVFDGNVNATGEMSAKKLNA